MNPILLTCDVYGEAHAGMYCFEHFHGHFLFSEKINEFPNIYGIVLESYGQCQRILTGCLCDWHPFPLEEMIKNFAHDEKFCEEVVPYYESFKFIFAQLVRDYEHYGLKENMDISFWYALRTLFLEL